MDGFASWAAAVCICAVIVTISEMLISDTALEKNVRLALGAFMLCAVIIPLGGVVEGIRDGIDIDTEELSQADISGGTELCRLDYIKEQLMRLINGKLEENGIYPVKTEVLTDIDEDNCITMIRAEISLSHNDARRATLAVRLIKKELGISCKTLITQ